MFFAFPHWPLAIPVQGSMCCTAMKGINVPNLSFCLYFERRPSACQRGNKLVIDCNHHDASSASVKKQDRSRSQESRVFRARDAAAVCAY